MKPATTLAAGIALIARLLTYARGKPAGWRNDADAGE